MKKVNLNKSAPFIILMLIAIIALFVPSFANFNDAGKYNTADITWILVATALGFFDDARSCLFLWRNGSQKKRSFYNDQKFCGSRYRKYFMDYRRI